MCCWTCCSTFRTTVTQRISIFPLSRSRWTPTNNTHMVRRGPKQNGGRGSQCTSEEYKCGVDGKPVIDRVFLHKTFSISHGGSLRLKHQSGCFGPILGPFTMELRDDINLCIFACLRGAALGPGGGTSMSSIPTSYEGCLSLWWVGLVVVWVPGLLFFRFI